MFKTHVVGYNPKECSKCFGLSCDPCRKRLKNQKVCTSDECHGQEPNEWMPSQTVNKIALEKRDKLQIHCEKKGCKNPNYLFKDRIAHWKECLEWECGKENCVPKGVQWIKFENYE